jgi:hypothetical protein
LRIPARRQAGIEPFNNSKSDKVNFFLIYDFVTAFGHDPNFVDRIQSVTMKKHYRACFLSYKPFGFDPELQTPDNITN